MSHFLTLLLLERTIIDPVRYLLPLSSATVRMGFASSGDDFQDDGSISTSC
jgi:hypothetical protein